MAELTDPNGTAAQPPTTPRATAGHAVLLAVLTIACLAPFITKPFHIDDPLFVWVAKHIESYPLDPYGFTVNWYGFPQPMYEIMRNPPLSCYFMWLASRAAAGMFLAESRRGSHALKFEGHWGFQYYMEAGGAEPMDMTSPTLEAGDILVIPRNSSNVARPPATFARLLKIVGIGSPHRLATMDPRVGAGFYAAAFGPLPFFAGRVPTEQYFVHSATGFR